MLELAVAVHLSDSCIQKFLVVRFLHCLIKVHGVWFRSGQVSKGVFHDVLYFIVILVHRLIVLLIVLFLLYRTERLVQVWVLLFPDFKGS